MIPKPMMIMEPIRVHPPDLDPMHVSTISGTYLGIRGMSVLPAASKHLGLIWKYVLIAHFLDA